jgi:ubiquilin
MVGSMMDEDQIANMLQNPHVAQQMNEMLNNDQFLDMMIQQNPMLRGQPNARDILRSPMFRNMMTNPDALRSAARMNRILRGNTAAQNAFPAPGVTDNTPADPNAPADNNAGVGAAGANPFDPALWANLQVPGGANNANANPFNAMFNPFAAMGAMGAQPSAAGAQPAAGAPTDSASPTAQSGTTTGQDNGGAHNTASSAPPNPFASLFGGAPPAGGAAANPFGMPPMSPEALQQMMQLMGMSSPGGTPAPADNRPPEERYEEQLRQLNDMGFYDFERNVAALRRSGGSVQGAVEYLLSS